MHVKEGVTWVIWLNQAETFQGLRKGGVLGREISNSGEQQGLKFRPPLPLLPVWNKHSPRPAGTFSKRRTPARCVRVQPEGGGRLIGPPGKWKFHADDPDPCPSLSLFAFFV